MLENLEKKKKTGTPEGFERVGFLYRSEIDLIWADPIDKKPDKSQRNFALSLISHRLIHVILEADGANVVVTALVLLQHFSSE